MYAVGVSANSLLAVKGVVVILLILLYSQQAQDFIRKITGQNRLKEIEVMRQNLSTFINKNRRLLPLSATIILFIIAYAIRRNLSSRDER